MHINMMANKILGSLLKVIFPETKEAEEVSPNPIPFMMNGVQCSTLVKLCWLIYLEDDTISESQGYSLLLDNSHSRLVPDQPW